MLKENSLSVPLKSANRTVAESIVKTRGGIRLVETIEYYLNELDRLEKELANALTQLSKDQKASAGGILALTISWTLPNQHPSMVDGDGLLLGRGVCAMRELEQFLNVEAEWVMDKYSEAIAGSTERTYYQGRLDQLAQVRRFLGQPQIIREKVSE